MACVRVRWLARVADARQQHGACPGPRTGQALLKSPDGFARLTVSEMQAEAPGNTQYRYFGDEAAAYACLAALSA